MDCIKKISFKEAIRNKNVVFPESTGIQEMQRFFVSKYSILLVARNEMIFSTCCVGCGVQEK